MRGVGHYGWMTGWTGWQWQGWEALVAIGTLSLAMYTYRLASETKLLAQQTSRDVEAQWVPILVQATTRQFASLGEDGVWAIEIRNAGKGPAMQVIAFDLCERYPQVIGGHTSGPHIIAAGAVETLRIDACHPQATSGDPFLEYHNAAGTRRYRTEIIVNRDPGSGDCSVGATRFYETDRPIVGVE